MGVVDFARAVDREGEVFDPHFEVLVFAAVGLPEAQSGLGLGTRNMFLTEAEVDDILGSPVGPKPALHREADWTKHAQVEGEGAVKITDREVDVVEASYRHSSSSVTPVRDGRHFPSYSSSPAALRASARSVYSSERTTLPLRRL